MTEYGVDDVHTLHIHRLPETDKHRECCGRSRGPVVEAELIVVRAEYTAGKTAEWIGNVAGVNEPSVARGLVLT